MSKPTNEPSHKPICKPTKQMDSDAELTNNLSPKKTREESFADQPTINKEIDHSIAASDSSKNQWKMPTPINLDSSELGQSTTMTNQNAHLHLESPQTTHLRLASPQSYTVSASKPFSTICSFQYGLSSSIGHSLAVKVQASSTLKVSCHAFALLAFEPVTSTKTNQLAKDSIERHSKDATVS
jgi:hypothetical protein